MQRCILFLTKPESTLAISLAQESGQDLSNLVTKLNLAINASEDVSKIEVNREEVDSILDILPMPKVNEDQNYKLLRNNLLKFLTNKDD